MLTDAELDEMVSIAATHKIEISLFARGNAGWHASVSARASAGGHFAPAARGTSQLIQSLEEIERAAAHGVRSVLIADIGTLWCFGHLRGGGSIPTTMQAKVSVSVPVTNPATAIVLEELGANTLNVAPDLGVAEVAEIRAVTDLPIDMYVESPDSLGGLTRISEIAEIVRVAAPVYLKFGVRGAPDTYPAGIHQWSLIEALSRERVRRVQLGLDALARDSRSAEWLTSDRGAEGIALPELTHRPLGSP